MKKYVIVAFVMLCGLFPTGLSAQTPASQAATPTAKTNWTVHRKILSEDGAYFTTDITYYDGLGRASQVNHVRAADNYQKDVIQHVQYDRMGRADSISFLPYVASTNNGLFIADPLTAQKAYYQTKFAGDMDRTYAYAKKTYDVSGLVSHSTGVGKSSAEHPVQYEYRMNVASDGVKKYQMYTDDESLSYTGPYAAGTLTVTKTWQSGLPADQQSESYTYVNSAGQTVAKEVRVGTDKRFTYYVYDDMGRQRYIIPPKQDAEITAIGRTELYYLTKYVYYTEYDDHGRVVKQYNAGAEVVYSVYDKRGRLVLTQDGSQRRNNEQWSFTKYDSQNRPVMTGVYTGGTLESHKAALQAQTVFGESRGTAMHGYTNVTYPVARSASDVYVVSYYDDYGWLSDSSYDFSPDDALGNTPNDIVTGLVTGTKTKVLDVSPDQWLTSVSYYDDKYRSIQSIADLYPSGGEIVSNTHDFLGNVTQTRVKQSVGTMSNEYNKWFNFDSYGRLLDIKQQITGGDLVTVAAYEYDDMGQVKAKKIHNAAETTTYTYDIAGRNIKQSSPSFSYNLWFDKDFSASSGLTGRHDGNLAHITWGNNTAGNQKGYTMSYDPYGQMTSAIYLQPNGALWTQTSKFSEKGITYDLHGNIKTLQRTNASGANLHTIAYDYSDSYIGDALTWVVINNDSYNANTFYYDDNGNMEYDGQTYVNFEYNILNLPKRIFAGNKEVTYIYSATGEKLAQKATDGSLTYYRSVMVYEKPSSGAEQLSYMLHPEGLASKNSNGSYAYRYFKTDHVGSTRVVLTASGNSLLVDQTTDFYPFGLAHDSQIGNLHLNKYLYGGKELQDASLNGSMLGLYDFHARFYNPIYGRWFNFDPARQFVNPYLYCGNSPLMYVDPDGEFAFLPILAAAFIGGVQANFSHSIEHGTNPFNPGNWNWSSPGTYLGMATSVLGPSLNVPGAIPNGFLQAGVQVSINGIGNIVDGRKFFDNWQWSAISGFVSGALTGYELAADRGLNKWTGVGRFDLTQGYAASGNLTSMPEGTITGRHVGKIENVNVYESKRLGDYSEGSYSGVTIPERGIIVGKGVYVNDWDMMKHEFGHILQYREYGRLAYYKEIAIPSLKSVALHPEGHRTFWVETHANYLSRNYFYRKHVIGSYPNTSTDFYWNYRGYPVRNISPENLERLLLWK